jgi:hypothetical protein
VDSGGDYLFVVKDNQPELKVAIDLCGVRMAFFPRPLKSNDKHSSLSITQWIKVMVV